MAQERPWLEPELTLTELAQRLRTYPAQLSKVINVGGGQNFNDFVNGYRVAEAQASRPSLCALLAGRRGAGKRI